MYGLTAVLLMIFNMNSPGEDTLYYTLGMEVFFLIVSIVGTLMLANNWKQGEKRVKSLFR